MRHDRPTVAELVEAVREFLHEKAQPVLDGQAAFHARVAGNALGIVLRQLERGADLDAAEHRRLVRLLGRDGSLGEPNRELCRRIRAGEMGLENAELMEHLWKTTRGKLEIDNPRYRSVGSPPL